MDSELYSAARLCARVWGYGDERGKSNETNSLMSRRSQVHGGKLPPLIQLQFPRVGGVCQQRESCLPGKPEKALQRAWLSPHSSIYLCQRTVTWFHNQGFVMSNRKQCSQYFPPWGSLTSAKDLFSLWPKQNPIFSSLLTVLLLKDFPTLCNSSSGISSLTIACQDSVSLLSYSPSASIAVKPGAANDAIRGKCEAHRSQCMGRSFCAYVQRWKLVIVIHRRGWDLFPTLLPTLCAIIQLIKTW